MLHHSRPKPTSFEIKLRSIVFGFDYPIALDTSKIDSHPFSSAIQTLSHLRPPNPARSPPHHSTQNIYTYICVVPAHPQSDIRRFAVVTCALSKRVSKFQYNMHPTAKDKPLSEKRKKHTKKKKKKRYRVHPKTTWDVDSNFQSAILLPQR